MYNSQILEKYLTSTLILISGTFLFDCDMQREQNKLRQNTTSLWSYLNDESVLCKLRNPLYERNECVLWPSVSPQSLVCILFRMCFVIHLEKEMSDMY